MTVRIPAHVSIGRWDHPDPQRVDLGYSASEPRDYHGRWTRGGAPIPGVQHAINSKAEYMRAHGIVGGHTPAQLRNVQAVPETARRIASAYDAMPSFDASPTTIRAYTALRNEVKAQYDHMVKSGIKVVVEKHDPYPSIHEMVKDVRDNHTLRVLGTDTTGGHPFFTNAENDMFRAVHDYYGHAATGRDFSRHGEEASYLSHADMFSPLARRALATETRGQNAKLNFGTDKGNFPEQKFALLPEWASDPSTVHIAKSQIVASASAPATLSYTPVQELVFTDIVSSLIELACHSAACRPPTSGGTGGSLPGGATGLLSSRVPEDTKTKVRAQIRGQSTRLSEFSPEFIQKATDRLTKFSPGFKHLQGASPDEVINYMTENILRSYDRATPEHQATWRQWYVGAHDYGADLGKANGLPADGARAIIAVMSPKTDWNLNVTIAKRAMEIMHENPVISRKVADEVNATQAATYAKAYSKYTQDLAKYEAGPKTGRRPTEPQKPEEMVPGQKLLSYPDFQAGLAVTSIGGRGWKTNEYVLGPDGKITEVRGTWKGVVWQTGGQMAKAVSVFKNPTDANVISAALGQEHKVRSFYNNMSDPHSAQGDVTVDTHAFGIALGTPVGMSHPLIASGSKNITGTPKDTATGGRGGYLLVAEAYRRAAAIKGIEPREMQSITWEQQRLDFPAAGKADRNSSAGGTVSRVEKIWEQVDSGALTHAQALDKINTIIKEGEKKP